MTKFRAAACTVDVTPDFPVNLSGSGYPEDKVSKIDSALEWQIVRLSNGTDELFILSGDFLSAGKKIRKIAESVLVGVKPENILVVASHSHSAPAIDDLLPRLGRTESKYLEQMTSSLTSALIELLQTPMQNVDLKHAKGTFAGNVYRRRRVWRPSYPFRSTVIMPNETVPVPHEIDFIRLENERSEPVAILWSWACHPNLYPDKQAISAEFPGYVRARFRTEYGNLPILFLQGFSGDINSTNYTPAALLKGRLKNIFYGKTFGRTYFEDWNNWAENLTSSLFETNQLAKRAAPLQSAPFDGRRLNIPLKELQDRSVDGRDLVIHKIVLAKGLGIIALGCEPVHGIAKLFSNVSAGETTILLGYADHIYGYLPTNRQLAENGYEDHGFRSNFSLPGRYYDDLEQRLQSIIDKSGF